MSNQIRVQIHDYDVFGNYHIVKEKMVTQKELMFLRKEALDSVPQNPFKDFPEFYKHIVYYADMRRTTIDGDVIEFAGIYMYGMAVSNDKLDEIVKNTRGGYIGACHRK